jgi:hypothetical protein
VLRNAEKCGKMQKMQKNAEKYKKCRKTQKKFQSACFVIQACSNPSAFSWCFLCSFETTQYCLGIAIRKRKSVYFRHMKRLKLSMSVSISHSAITSASVLTLSWRFVFGAVKRDWLLILVLQTCIIFSL